eukprot:g20537.t1
MSRTMSQAEVDLARFGLITSTLDLDLDRSSLLSKTQSRRRRMPARDGRRIPSRYQRKLSIDVELGADGLLVRCPSRTLVPVPNSEPPPPAENGPLKAGGPTAGA